MKSSVDDIKPLHMWAGDEKLIELVRPQKILYNKTRYGPKGLQLKQQAWKLIAEELGSTALECSKRWKTIRERYSRELRLRDGDPEGKTDNAVEWPLLKSLSFLSKYIVPRGPRTSMKSPSEFGFVDTRGDDYLSDSCYSFYEEVTATPKEEVADAKEEGADANEEVMSPSVVVTTKEVELPKETANASNELTASRPSTAIQMFGQTVAAFISDMSEAKQAKAMRVLFDTLIAIKMEPEES